MKYLSEVYIEGIETEIINEVNTGSPKSYYIKGPFIQADIKNKNGRIYPLPIVMKEVNRYDDTFIKSRRSLGELMHPNGRVEVDLKEASHLIESLTQDGKNFIGKAKILDTPNGKIVKNFIDEGIQLAVSTRGVGSLMSRNGANIVGEDFHLSTIDCVLDPSAHSCFVESIMESKEFYFENGLLKEKQYEDIQKQIKDTTKTEINEGALLKIFENFMKSL